MCWSDISYPQFFIALYTFFINLCFLFILDINLFRIFRNGTSQVSDKC